MTATDGQNDFSGSEFLATVEGEIAFFRSIMRARPVGIHRHFHVLGIQNAIQRDTGRLVTSNDVWEKLKTCYDLEALENNEVEYDYFAGNGSAIQPIPPSIPSPSPLENLSGHPFFRSEYSIPHDETVEALISSRRLRTSASVPSSPEPAPAPTKTRRGMKRGKSKLDMAGLVAGDSDSSALTQESGDEEVPPTPRGSVKTGTDGGTEDGEDEDVDMLDQSPSPSASSKPIRNRTKSSKKAASGKPKAKTTPRPSKKKKR